MCCARVIRYSWLEPMQLQIPMIQYTLDAALAEKARAQALEQVEANADDAWKRAAMSAVYDAARAKVELTTDDVLEILRTQPVATHEGRALGPVMLRAAQQGWIENTGRVKKSLAVSRHRAPKTIWASRIYQRSNGNG